MPKGSAVPSSGGEDGLAGHIPPRPPIDLNPVWPKVERTSGEIILEQTARSAEIELGEKIWIITRQVAEGVNPPIDSWATGKHDSGDEEYVRLDPVADMIIVDDPYPIPISPNLDSFYD